MNPDDPIDMYGPRPDDGDRSYDHWLSESQPQGPVPQRPEPKTED